MTISTIFCCWLRNRLIIGCVLFLRDDSFILLQGLKGVLLGFLGISKRSNPGGWVYFGEVDGVFFLDTSSSSIFKSWGSDLVSLSLPSKRWGSLHGRSR